MLAGKVCFWGLAKNDGYVRYVNIFHMSGMSSHATLVECAGSIHEVPRGM